MQQTEKYKLNLIERDDVFSPEALNENAQKLETALSDGLSAEAAARINADTAEAQARINADTAEAQTRAAADSALSAADAALDARVQALEGHKIYFGTIIGSGENPQFVNLGYTPVAVYLHCGATGSYDGLLMDGNYNSHSSYNVAQIVENGVKFCSYGVSTITPFYNKKGTKTYYIAFV